MGRRGRDRLKDFSLESMARQTFGLYTDAAAMGLRDESVGPFSSTSIPLEQGGQDQVTFPDRGTVKVFPWWTWYVCPTREAGRRNMKLQK